MKPVLYRYKDTESVVRAMDGYTPGEGWTPLFEAPATAPEKTVKEIMEFVRHYAANTFSSATLEDKIRRSLATPATAQVLTPLQDGEKIYALWHSSDANDLDDFLDGWRHAEAFHGIKGDKP